MTTASGRATGGAGGARANETGADILAAARAIGPLIRAEAEAIEAAGRLTDKVVAALKESGVIRMTIPRSMGGPAAFASRPCGVGECAGGRPG